MIAAIALLAALETTFTLTVNALDGSHQVNGGAVSRLNFAPLPLGELRLRSGADALVFEGLPPVAFSYNGDSGIGRTTTRLSILNAVYRRSFGGGWWAGAGETLYDQHTTYAQQPGAIYTRYATGTIYPIAGQEEQWSRVTGARYEAGRTWRRGSTGLEAVAAVSPVLHGIQYTYIPTGAPGSPTFADVERTSQLDLRVMAARRAAGRGELLYGLRYLHYSGRYVDQPGQLADRNVGLAPVAGYRLRL